MKAQLAEDKIERSKNKQQGSGHSYSLEMFGLTKADIQREFGPYVKQFLPK